MQSSAADGSLPVYAALDALASRLGVGLLLAAADGRLLFASGRALALLGCEPGKDAPDRLDRWAGLHPVETGDRAPGPGPFTLEIPLPDGKSRMLRGQRRAGAAGVTEILLADRRVLGEYDLELLCASRMREWSHQCEAVVHDANGALNTIQLTLELLDGQWPGPQAGEQVREPHRRNHVGVLRDNVEKLKLALRKLMAAHDEPSPGPYELGAVLKEAAATLKMPARRKRIEMQVAGAELPLRANGNRARMRQALVNVALSRMERLPERARMQIEAAAGIDGRLVLSCTDTGSLPAAACAGIHLLVAEPGAAPGAEALRLARAIVESEGGDFEVEATEGCTRLRFVLPAA